MKNMINRFFSLILVLLLSTILVSCNVLERDLTPYLNNEPYTLSFDAIGGKDVMPISVFYSPFSTTSMINGNKAPDFTDEKYIKLFADAGINIFSCSIDLYPNSKQSIEKVLTLAEKYNIGYFVKEFSVYEMVLGLKEVDESKIEQVINELSKYKAFIGLNLYDEPAYESMIDIGKVNSAINRLGNDKYASYVNLLPYYNNIKYNKGNEEISYQDYVEEYLSKGNGKYLCFDFYVFDNNNFVGYFENLDIVKKYCDIYKVPFWCFIQAGGQWNDLALELESTEYFPSEGQLLWNVNTAVACGSKGIQYFPGIQPLYFAYAPNGTYDFSRNAMIGADGSINEWYYYAQKVNKQIQACGDIIMNSINRGVIASGSALEDLEGLDMLINSGKFHQLIGVEGDALIGCLEHNKETSLYVVNYSFDKAQDIILKFDTNYSLRIVQRGEVKNITCKNVKIHLESGEAILCSVSDIEKVQ